MKPILIIILTTLFLNSCANKKEILYLQNAESFNNSTVTYENPTIQVNDILKITVATIEAEAAIPYNRMFSASGQASNLDIMKLEGYIVNEDYSINFPQLGDISTKGMTVNQLQNDIKFRLESGGHLKNPTVNVRVLNSKVTVLGEVKQPGTFSFSEQNITLLQALGYAGDLTINGKREDILIMRETDSQRQVAHIDLTSAELLNSPFYFIKPNDVIVINPNQPKVKSSGYIGNIGSLLSVFSIVLSTVIILTR